MHPQLQGRGVGRMLAAAAEQFVRRRLGLRRVHLSTGSFMLGAPAFYRALGYSMVGAQIFPVFVPQSVHLQIVYFEKTLL